MEKPISLKGIVNRRVPRPARCTVSIVNRLLEKHLSVLFSQASRLDPKQGSHVRTRHAANPLSVASRYRYDNLHPFLGSSGVIFAEIAHGAGIRPWSAGALRRLFRRRWVVEVLPPVKRPG